MVAPESAGVIVEAPLITPQSPERSELNEAFFLVHLGSTIQGLL